jgi:hypothetical protein
MNKNHPSSSIALALIMLGMRIKSVVEPCMMEDGKILLQGISDVYIKVTHMHFTVVKIVGETEVLCHDRKYIADLLIDLRSVGVVK